MDPLDAMTDQQPCQEKKGRGPTFSPRFLTLNIGDGRRSDLL